MQLTCKNYQQCPLCKSPNLSHYLDFDQELNGIMDAAQLQKCTDCEIVFLNPMPTDDDLAKIYASRSFGVDIATDSKLGHIFKSVKLWLYVRKLLSKYSPKSPIRVLDVGCGDGLLTLALDRHKATGEVFGADFSDTPPDAIQASTTVKYVHLAKIDGKFDLIVLRHVLEHTTDPIGFIANLAKKLSPNGVIMIEIPNIDTHWLRAFGEKYNQLVFPVHLYHFTKQSFLNQYENHYKIAQFRYVHIPVLGPSLGKAVRWGVSNIGLVALMFYPLQILIDLVTANFPAMVFLIQNKRDDRDHGKT